jgi:hypothetical protein
MSINGQLDNENTFENS